MNLIRRTAVAGMLVATGACSESTAPNASATFDGIRLTVSGSSAEVVRGSPVTFRIELVNEGTEAVTLHFSDSCQIVPTIRNAIGEILVGRWVCLTVFTELTLLPGQPVVQEFVWTGSTEFRSEMPLRPLPPGKYFFTAKVPSDEATLSATTVIRLR